MKILLIIYIILITAYLSTLIYQMSLTYITDGTKNILYRILLILSLPLNIVAFVLINMLWDMKI